MKYFLVSGIGPSNGGVGRLMKVLEPRARTLNYTTIYRRTPKSIRQMLSRKAIFSVLVEIAARLIDDLRFNFSLSRIANSNILLLHPQTVGFRNVLNLAAANKIFLYVMDNSFFCARSYNNNPITKLECLQCIGNPENIDVECDTYSERITKEQNKVFLKKLLNISGKITFLAQNENQKRLLLLHFGSKTSCTIVGMNTGEVKGFVGKSATNDQSSSYDLVYHGGTHLAKGIGYFVELATRLPDFSCFIPDSQRNVENTIGEKISGKNITFTACTWETGLLEIVSNARLVINPSLWSASIEGALLKSIAFNANVAVVETEYGYASEIADDAFILTLPSNPDLASRLIRQFLSNEGEIPRSNSMWLERYLLSNSTNNVFDAI